MPLTILLLGKTDRTEFRDARQCMDRWATVHEAADVDAAADMLTKGQISPDVFVIAQAFPGQFSHQAVDRLRRLAPVARWVGLMGTWCEGEMRTGSPWPGVVRTYWHQWAARCDWEFRRMTDARLCSWALPPTASEEERLLAATDSPSSPSDASMQKKSPHGLLLIRTPSNETAHWLAAACRSRGFSTVWQREAASARVEGATAVLFDACEMGERECEELQRLANSVQPTPVVALLGFPRVEDRRRALASGAKQVLSKPLLLNDLWETIEGSGRECSN